MIQIATPAPVGSAPIPTTEAMIDTMTKQKSIAGEEDKNANAGKNISYETMSHLFTPFRDDVQLKKLEEMLEYIKLEVEKSREKIRKLDGENSSLRDKFKEAFTYTQQPPPQPQLQPQPQPQW